MEIWKESLHSFNELLIELLTTGFLILCGVGLIGLFMLLVVALMASSVSIYIQNSKE